MHGSEGGQHRVIGRIPNAHDFDMSVPATSALELWHSQRKRSDRKLRVRTSMPHTGQQTRGHSRQYRTKVCVGHIILCRLLSI